MIGFWRKREDPTQRELTQRLAALPLFVGLERGAMDALGAELEWLALPAGTLLFDQGEHSDALYVLLYGRLLAERRGRDGFRAVGSVGAGETVGEAGLLAGEPRNARVTAVRDCELLRLSEQALERVAALHPHPMLRLARFALRRYARQRDQPAPPTCFALLPATPGVDVAGFAHALLEALGDPDGSLLVDESERGRDAAWFAEREAQATRVFYLGDAGSDPASTAWRERCVRQSDMVLLLAAAAGPAEQAQVLAPTAVPAQVPVLLALLGDSPAAGRTRGWRARFPQAASHLHVRGPADLARLARRMTGRQGALVLSGGGARGFAHLGAVRALRSAGVPIDHVGGCSIGAILGAGVAADWDDATLREVYHRNFVIGRPVRRWTLPLLSLYSGRSVTRLLHETFGELDIEDLPLPFYCVTTDLTEGRLKVHEDGCLWKWLRATSAIPGILPPVFAGGRVLVDGGVIDNLPVREMRSRVQGEIVAVDAGADYALPTTLEQVDPPPWWRLLADVVGERRQPRISQILLRAGMVNSDATARRWRQHADLMIAPHLPDVDLLDWRAFDRAIEAGYAAAMEALEARDRVGSAEATNAGVAL